MGKLISQFFCSLFGIAIGVTVFWVATPFAGPFGAPRFVIRSIIPKAPQLCDQALTFETASDFYPRFAHLTNASDFIQHWWHLVHSHWAHLREEARVRFGVSKAEDIDALSDQRVDDLSNFLQRESVRFKGIYRAVNLAFTTNRNIQTEYEASPTLGAFLHNSIGSFQQAGAGFCDLLATARGRKREVLKLILSEPIATQSITLQKIAEVAWEEARARSGYFEGGISYDGSWSAYRIPDYPPIEDSTGSALSSYDWFRLLEETVFHELIFNAVKYRSKDRPLHVTLRLSVEGDQMVLAFEDNGIGILGEHIKHIGESGYKGQREEAALAPGINAHSGGVGISALKNLLMDIGGTLEVKSPREDGQPGTLFRVSLPVSLFTPVPKS